MPMLTRATLFLSVVGNGIDIARATDRDEGVSLSFQVVLRIVTTLVATGCGAWGWWRFAAVRAALKSVRGILALGLVFCMFAAASTSPSPYIAFFVAHAVVAYMLLSITCVVLQGLRRTIMDAMLGLWTFVILSWIVRFVAPDMTVAIEYLATDDAITRFGGLGHPNVLGAISCMAMLLLLVSARAQYVNWLWLLPCSVVFIATIVESKSRTPAIALACATILMYLPLLRQRSTYLLISVGLASMMIFLTVLEFEFGIDRALKSVAVKFTKTGSIEELTSATGRTEIWAQAIELISRSPLTGYGGGNSTQIMLEHSGHAHNFVLETALLFGIPAAILLCLLLCINISDSLRHECPFVSEFTAFLLILGLVESPLFGLVPDPAMCIWMACLFGPIVERGARSKSDNLSMARPAR
jgi:exopolysaccharide production protein ExoQ